MKLLFASDSFKGSLSSAETIKLLGRAAEEVFGDVEYSGVAVADGGEGTVDAVVQAGGGSLVTARVCGPLMSMVDAGYGILPGGRAVIEMAAASGLTLISEEERDPLKTTSRGTGELILDALERGCRDISVAIGGSATNDGGMGCAAALGIRFLDEDGCELAGTGADLERVRSIDMSGLDKRAADAKFTVMCDVSNPLCGENGATYTFGAQKGASAEALGRLDAGMCNYRDVIKRQFGADADKIAGAGAAGGLGAALSVFLNGEMRSGIETVLDLIDFDKRLGDADLVVTGEGSTDWQSCFGKVMQGVGERAKAHGVPAVGLCGSLGRGAEDIFDHGIASLMTAVDAPTSLNEALDNAEELYYLAAIRMFRFIKAGMDIPHRTRT